MIHATQGRYETVPGTISQERRSTLERTEVKVETWIRRNPLLGIGLALAAGMGIGFLLKRR